MHVIDLIVNVNDSSMYTFYLCFFFSELVIFVIKKVITQSSGKTTDFPLVMHVGLLQSFSPHNPFLLQ